MFAPVSWEYTITDSTEYMQLQTILCHTQERVRDKHLILFTGVDVQFSNKFNSQEV